MSPLVEEACVHVFMAQPPTLSWGLQFKADPPPSTNLREFYVPEELCVRVALHKHPFNLRCILEQLLRVLCYSNFPYLQVLSLSPRLVLTVVHPVPAFVGGLP